MNSTNTQNRLTAGKKLNLSDYLALYQMSLRSFFWRVDSRQGMDSFKSRDMFSMAIRFFCVMISYGLPVILAFSLFSFVQAIILTPLRWIFPNSMLAIMHPGIFIGWILLSLLLIAICSPMVYNKDRLKYNLNFTKSAWWNNTGIPPRFIAKDLGLYGEYIATMAAEQNMKNHGLHGKVFNTVIIPKADGNFNESDVVCVSEAGIQVIEAKYRGGSFVGQMNQKNWVQYIGNEQHDMTNPLYQNNNHINCLINYLFDNLPNGSAKTKASFPYSYVNVSLMSNPECDISQLSAVTAPAQYFFGQAEGANGYINLDIQKEYKIRFSKREVDDICAVIDQITGYSLDEVREKMKQRKSAEDKYLYSYLKLYSIVRLESVTFDGNTETNDFVCREDCNKKTKEVVFRYFMDPKDKMFKAIPNSRIVARSAKTEDLSDVVAYYERRNNG